MGSNWRHAVRSRPSAAFPAHEGESKVFPLFSTSEIGSPASEAVVGAQLMEKMGKIGI